MWAWALVGLIVLLLLHMTVYFNFSEDDPGISFRYAANLANGRGLVYNPGESVEGYSNFGFLLVITVLFKLIVFGHRLPLLFAVKVMNAVAAAACVVAVARAAEKEPNLGRGQGLTAALLLVSAGSFAVSACSALETVTLTLLLLVTVGALTRTLRGSGAEVAEGVRLGLLLVTVAVWRIDAVVLSGIMVVYLVAARRGRLRRADAAAVVTLATLYGIYTAFRWFYFGDILPNTFYAKVQLDPSLAGGWTYLSRFLGSHGGLAFIALCAVAGIFGKSHLERLGAALFIGQFVYTGVVQGDWMPGFRFFMPVLPFLALLAANVLHRVTENLGHTWGRLALSVVLVTASASLFIKGTQNYRELWLREPFSWLRRPTFRLAQLTPYVGVARWIEANLTADATIALQEGGFIPFLTDRKAIDTFGLCDRELAHFRGVTRDRFGLHVDLMDGASAVVQAILARKPDALFILPTAPPDPPKALHGGAYALAALLPLNQFAAGLNLALPSRYRCAVYVRRDSSAVVDRAFFQSGALQPDVVGWSQGGVADGLPLAGGSWRTNVGTSAWIEGRFEQAQRVSGMRLGLAGSTAATEGLRVRILFREGRSWRAEFGLSDRNIGFPLDGTFGDSLTVVRLRFSPARDVDAVRVELRGAAPLVFGGFGLSGVPATGGVPNR